MKRLSTLPGEGLSVLGCTMCCTSSKRCRDVSVMGRESADEAVVVVKLDASDGMVTYLRGKHSVSDQRVLVEGEGWNMKSVFKCFIWNCHHEFSHIG